MNQVGSMQRQTVVVAGADNASIMNALSRAAVAGLVTPILVGNGAEIRRCCKDNFNSDWKIIDSSSGSIAETAVKQVRSIPGALLMKGRISTAGLMKAVLDRKNGIRGGGLLSHIAVVESPGYDKLLFITDGAINIHPDELTLERITCNAIEFVRAMGIPYPRTALITLVEEVNSKILSTVIASNITEKLSDREIIEGPVSIDIALSQAAAKEKNVNSKISGQTDIMVMPNAISCNVVVKALRLVGGGRIGGVIVGAKTPILMVSRSDDSNSKFRSIILGLIYQNRQRNTNSCGT